MSGDGRRYPRREILRREVARRVPLGDPVVRMRAGEAGRAGCRGHAPHLRRWVASYEWPTAPGPRWTSAATPRQ